MAWRLMRARERRPLPGWLWPVAIAAVSLIWLFSSRRFTAAYAGAFGLSLGAAVPLFQEIRSQTVARAVKVIARYSYGIYLTHFPIMVYLISSSEPGPKRVRLLPPFGRVAHFGRPLHLILVVLLTAGASALLYHLVEEPGIRLGRNLAKRLRRRGQPMADPPLGDSGAVASAW